MVDFSCDFASVLGTRPQLASKLMADDLPRARRVALLPQGSTDIFGADVSVDGALIAVGSWTGDCRVFTTGEILGTSEDRGTTLADNGESQEDTTAVLPGHALVKLDDGSTYIGTIAFGVPSTDALSGRVVHPLLVAGGNGIIEVVDVMVNPDGVTATPRHRLTIPDGGTDFVRDGAMDRDLLEGVPVRAFTGTRGGEVHVWDYDNGEHVSTMRGTGEMFKSGEINSMDLSKGSEFLATASDGMLGLWTVGAGSGDDMYTQQSSVVERDFWACAFLPDGASVFGSRDLTVSVLTQYSVPDLTPLRVIELGQPDGSKLQGILHISMSPTGTLLALAGNSEVKIVEILSDTPSVVVYVPVNGDVLKTRFVGGDGLVLVVGRRDLNGSQIFDIMSSSQTKSAGKN
jgi:WD40 repeat protein